MYTFYDDWYGDTISDDGWIESRVGKNSRPRREFIYSLYNFHLGSQTKEVSKGKWDHDWVDFEDLLDSLGF